MIRFIANERWEDDLFLRMSQDQKLIWLYLLSGPQATQCGIGEFSFERLAFHIGARDPNGRSAIEAFLKQYSDEVLFDESTGELAVLNWTRYQLINAGQRGISLAAKSLQNVRSYTLCMEVFNRSSATLGAMYLKRAKQIQMTEINAKKQNHGTDVIGVDNQQLNSKVKIENIKDKKKKKETRDERAFFSVETIGKFPINGKKRELINRIGKRNLEHLTSSDRLDDVDPKRIKLIIDFLEYRRKLNPRDSYKLESGFYANAVKPFIDPENGVGMLEQAIEICRDKEWKGIEWGIAAARKKIHESGKAIDQNGAPIESPPPHIISLLTKNNIEWNVTNWKEKFRQMNTTTK